MHAIQNMAKNNFLQKLSANILQHMKFDSLFPEVIIKPKEYARNTTNRLKQLNFLSANPSSFFPTSEYLIKSKNYDYLLNLNLF